LKYFFEKFPLFSINHDKTEPIWHKKAGTSQKNWKIEKIGRFLTFAT
jgi:hypothetical protein